MDLEHRIEESILISDVCDIVYYHAVEHFSVFKKYVINQVYQEKNYRRILWVPYFIKNKLLLLLKNICWNADMWTSYSSMKYIWNVSHQRKWSITKKQGVYREL